MVKPDPEHSGYRIAGLVPAREIPTVGWGPTGRVRQSAGFALARHDTAHYNGAYRVIDERDGWPVLRNENGIWMFRPSHTGYSTSTAWVLSKNHGHDSKVCSAYIKAPGKKFSFLCPVSEKYGTLIERCNALIENVSPCTDGSFPLGEQTWQRFDSNVAGNFKEVTMSLRSLVRSQHAFLIAVPFS
eukprot:SAG31_NODE_535_length_14348_cov_11.339603_22_plen_186_part_00